MLIKKYTPIGYLIACIVFGSISFAQTNIVKHVSQKSHKKDTKTYAKGEVIVVMKEGYSENILSSVLSSNKIKVLKKFQTLSSHVKNKYILLEGKLSTEVLIGKLKINPYIKSVSPNYRRKLYIEPNDERYIEQWALNNTGQDIFKIPGTEDADMDAPEAWDTESNASGVVVAIFDTGVDYAHEDLRSNIWVNNLEFQGTIGVDDDNNGYIDDIYGYDFASNNNGDNDSDPMDINGHGTHIAGIIGATGNNNVGIVGVNWDVEIMPIKVFRPDLGAYDSDVLEAIDYILTMKSKGVNIAAINASFGETEGSQTDPMNDAIKSLGDAGIIYVAAAGNEDVDNDVRAHYPSSYNAKNIIAVAATDHNDKLASFSNFGTKTVDIAAPGVDILSTLPGEGEVDNSIFFDDGESGIGNWITSGKNNTWALTEEDSNSATHAWSDSPNNKYKNDTNASLTYASDIDLRAYTREHIGLGACMIYELEKGFHAWMLWDKVYIEISSNSGNDWTVLHEIGSKQNHWKCSAYPIPTEYKTENFRMRFRIDTDGSTVLDGIYIDDIAIGLLSASKKYGYLSGTSMATPYVVGSAALMAKKYPDENITYRMIRILKSADQLNVLKGKVATGGRLNIANAMHLDITPPMGEDDNIETKEDNNVSIAVLQNDVDVDILSITNLTQPKNGVVDSNGTVLRYIPKLNYSGVDTFTYTPNDSVIDGNIVTVTVTVLAENDTPIGVEDTAITDENIAVTIFVLKNDTDVDKDTITITNLTTPANGSTIMSDSNITYIPNNNYNGIDTFTYTPNDGTIDGNTVTVTITINAVNSIPIGNNDTIETDENVAIVIDVLKNDMDADQDLLGITNITIPTNGIATISDTNILYTPEKNFYGTDTFTYTPNDSTEDGNVVTVTVLVKSDGDSDNDGVLDENDAFPNDSNETMDTDKDGIGNNADLDDDADSVSDIDEVALGTNPLDVNDTPNLKDTDNDGIIDVLDTDDDNDGILDVDDTTPLGDSNETSNLGSSGGGCTYNPNNNNIDMIFILMMFGAVLYPFKRKYLK